MPVQTIFGGFPSPSYRIGKLSQDDDSIFPMNAGICDTNPLRQSTRSLGRNILSTYVLISFRWVRGRTFIEITLNHDTSDETFAIGDLSRDVLCDLGLILVILHRIPMRTINHHTLVQNSRLGHGLATYLNRRSIVICPSLATVPVNQRPPSGVYPLRITKQSAFPLVRVMAANPCFVTPRKE